MPAPPQAPLLRTHPRQGCLAARCRTLPGRSLPLPPFAVCRYLGACVEPPSLIMEFAAKLSLDTLLAAGLKDPQASSGSTAS